MIAFMGAGITGAARRLAVLLAPVVALALSLALAGCNDTPGKSADGPAANPLFYEIASAGGAVEGWLVGTIHALPPGTHWRTPVIEQAITEADVLVVEVADLANSAGISRVFAELARSPDLPALDERVPPHLHPALAEMLGRGGMDAGRFRQTETWAVALALARVDAQGDPANGADRALIAAFAGRPVRELEGARAQIAIFDQLPETDQRAMLAAIVSEAERARADPARLQRAWLAGDAQAIEAASRSGMLADPELRAALLVDRNRRWVTAIVPLLSQSARPLIAVGAAHLVGPDGLVARLQAEGYRVRRLP